MQLHKIFIALFLLLTVPFLVANEKEAKSEAEKVEKSDGHSGEAHHKLPQKAPQIVGPEGKYTVGPLQITNSMVVTIVVALLIILMAQAATSNVQLIPSGLQNFVELLVESLYGFFESILGPDMVKQTFWFFGTIFIFILFSNWFGLIPGLGTVGFDVGSDGHVHKPILRGVNADLNMTLAMAALFMVLWLYWSLKTIGVGGFLGHIFNVKGHGGGFFGIFLVVVFIFVGLIEVVSIGVRPVALTFRLYGNVFAGENILETVMNLGNGVVPYIGGAIAVLPFYVLEILVGLVQALVFALLTSVFTALMCEHHGDEHAH
jgi:F-type H+-transporting ATPase subunit a